MATTSTGTHFFNLPGEIRNTIYTYMFGDLAVHTCSPDFIRDARRFTNTRWSTALFTVSRQIRQEALAAFSDSLTVYARWDEMHIIAHDFSQFVRSTASRALVVFEILDDIWTIPTTNMERYRAVLPRLQRLELLFDGALRNYWPTTGIYATEDMIYLLRGGMDKDFITHMDAEFLEAEQVKGLNEENVWLIRAIQPMEMLDGVCLDHLYRLEWQTKDVSTVVGKINLSQSRSYAFGKWVSADSVVLLVDGVSCPVVWSVEYGRGRVLSKKNDVIQRVEEQLEDPATLARALENGFSCARHLASTMRTRPSEVRSSDGLANSNV